VSRNECKTDQSLGFFPLVTIWNVALRRDFGKRRAQEVRNEFPSSKFFKQVGGKNWRLHLLLNGAAQK
jgi:hypothetical protein